MFRTLTTAATALLLTAGAAMAGENHVVEMLNRNKDTKESMVFKPAVLKIAPGDTVTFKPTNKGHNAELIDGLMPEGAEAFKGGINKEITVTFDTEGVYGYKCAPHFATGMIGFIQVGDSTDGMEAIEGARFPGRSGKRRDEYLATLNDLSS
ncbi:MAG: pseudoazurin [Pseudomonadota bacterium]